MRESFVALLICPYCGDGLTIDSVSEHRGGEIWAGSLACMDCSSTFAIRWGMAFVHREDESWSTKAREAAGWVEIHKRQGIYEQPEKGIDLQIPYVGEEPWLGVARRFDQALDILNLDGSERVLDLGAGRGWAAKQFALRGCEAVALDVTWDENIGLGRGRALMEDADVFFERIIGDGEKIPLAPETFDVVFCSAALHHAQDLPRLLGEVGRVLRPGGRLCAIREPVLGVIDDEATELARDGSEEMDVGINETRPTYDAYLSALQQAGLTPLKLVPGPSLAMSNEEVQVWARDLGAVWAWPDWRRPKRTVWRLWAYGSKRLRAWRLGQGLSLKKDQARDARARALTAAARWTTGELFLLAEKQRHLA